MLHISETAKDTATVAIEGK